MRKVMAAILAFAVVLGACSDDDGDQASTPPADQPAATTTTAGDDITDTSLAPGSLTLGPRSLGGVPFGTAETEAEAALTEALGPPGSDNVLPPGSCSTGATRSLSWGDLNVFFGPGDGDGGGTVLAGWTYGSDELPASPPAATTEGVGAGATLAQLRSAYGERLKVDEDDPAGAVRFSVAGAGGDIGITGVLTGSAATDTVRGLFAGGYCG